MKTVIPPHLIQLSRHETELMRQGRAYRSRRKPKTLGWWLQTALSLIWVFFAIKGATSIPLLSNLDEPAAMQEVVTTAIILTILSVCLIVTHFKTGKTSE